LEEISEFPKLVVQLAEDESSEGANQFGPVAAFSKFVAQSVMDDIGGTIVYLNDTPEQSMVEDENKQAKEEKGWMPDVMRSVEYVQERVKGSLEQPKDDKSQAEEEKGWMSGVARFVEYVQGRFEGKPKEGDVASDYTTADQEEKEDSGNESAF